MCPREHTSLLKNGSSSNEYFDISQGSFAEDTAKRCSKNKRVIWAVSAVVACIVLVAVVLLSATTSPKNKLEAATGQYQLVECQEGESFFDHYTFYDGADSIGSAGFNVYVGEKRAKELKIIGLDEDNHVLMKSAPTHKGPRESIRLEGKNRYDRGLFILDLLHMPAGAGVWPAWWLTDETNWPDNGEIDIVEGINNQTRAKTALHTSAQCSMFAHVADYAKTGTWDWASKLSVLCPWSRCTLCHIHYSRSCVCFLL